MAVDTKRHVSVALVVSTMLLFGSCGGSSPSSPTSPSAAPAPTPVYPSMVGVWTGNLSNTNSGDISGSYTCPYQFSISSQTQGTFGGTFFQQQSSDANCVGRSGTLTGSVSTAGGATVTPVGGTNPICTPQGSIAWSGNVSGGRTMFLSRTYTDSCTGGFTVRRTQNLSLTKQ